MIRTAISPRLAMRIFMNRVRQGLTELLTARASATIVALEIAEGTEEAEFTNGGTKLTETNEGNAPGHPPADSVIKAGEWPDASLRSSSFAPFLRCELRVLRLLRSLTAGYSRASSADFCRVSCRGLTARK